MKVMNSSVIPGQNERSKRPRLTKRTVRADGSRHPRATAVAARNHRTDSAIMPRKKEIQAAVGRMEVFRGRQR